MNYYDSAALFLCFVAGYLTIYHITTVYVTFFDYICENISNYY